ncbi:MAG: mycolipenoyl-CoA---2-(long-chain-fatty acyl)-trehalose mycolipenoyltransferase, partial [Mycobacterium sp.]|nr:mycolipenoyl-CoA---2-(long-chain-fatty acyl)-trehalose mycolipenoyltransferase [Mycobacterium sp.]
MRIGKITVGSLDEWALAPGSVTSWHPKATAQEKVRQAPISSVPVSYMQGQHLRNYCERTSAGLNFSRQIIASCDVPGHCDISAMDHALNAYLRRHDTFRSWFEDAGDGQFIRHSISDPADIEFEPINHGHMTVDEIHAHVVSIPSPLEWGCFTFGIIQGEGHFTFFAAMDHVHGDATLIGTTMLEANGMYSALSGGGPALELPDAGSFDD